MLEELLELDKELFLYLNGLGTPFWDGFWLYLSRTLSAITIPIYVFVILLSYRIFGWRKTIIIIAMTALLIGCTELLSILLKNSTERPRPCHQVELASLMRQVRGYCGGPYSFYSAHATNAWAFASFFGMLFYKKSKFFTGLLLLWASLVSYSRIYIGVHFPLDVLTGVAVGVFFGYLFGASFFRTKLHR